MSKPWAASSLAAAPPGGHQSELKVQLPDVILMFYLQKQHTKHCKHFILRRVVSALEKTRSYRNIQLFNYRLPHTALLGLTANWK